MFWAINFHNVKKFLMWQWKSHSYERENKKKKRVLLVMCRLRTSNCIPHLYELKFLIHSFFQLTYSQWEHEWMNEWILAGSIWSAIIPFFSHGIRYHCRCHSFLINIIIRTKNVKLFIYFRIDWKLKDSKKYFQGFQAKYVWCFTCALESFRIKVHQHQTFIKSISI